MEGRHCTGARSNTGKVYCRGADSDNFKATVTSRSNTGEVYCTGADVDSIKVTDTSRSNTGEVYCRGTDADNIKNMTSTPAYSVKGYDNSTVARAQSNAN